jgi:hypothetical protein
MTSRASLPRVATRDEHGITLPEILVVSLVFLPVVLGLMFLFRDAARVTNEGTAASFVQRQGTLLQEEMARLILPGLGLPAGGCGGAATPESQEILRPADTPPTRLCVFRDGGEAVPQIYVCTWNGAACSDRRNLLAGSPVRIRATAIRFTPLVLVGISPSLDVSFTLATEDHGVPPLTFGMNLTVRN